MLTCFNDNGYTLMQVFVYKVELTLLLCCMTNFMVIISIVSEIFYSKMKMLAFG